MTLYHAETQLLQPARGTGGAGQITIAGWLIRRFRARRARRQQEKILSRLDPHMLHDIGLANFQRRPGLPAWAVYNPHMIAIGLSESPKR
jgi:hypothetical protein